MASSETNNESERIRDLYDHELLDTPPTQEYEDLVRLAALLCDVPVAAVTLVDNNRIWFKAITGASASEIPSINTPCSYTVKQTDVMVVSDTSLDARFCDDLPHINDFAVRFYAGVPLVSENGYALGALCIIDNQPRRLSVQAKAALQMLARQATTHLALANKVAQLKRLIGRLDDSGSVLQKQGDFQQALLESLDEGIIACDAQGYLTLCNRTFRDFHGVDAHSVPAEEWSRNFDLYDADGVSPMEKEEIPLFRALQGELVKDVEMVIAPKDGISRCVMANGRPIIDPNGNNIGAVVAMHDVTERRQIEREMERLAAVVESSVDGIFAGNLSGDILSWNKGAERIFGYTKAEVIGRQYSCLDGNREKVITQDLIQAIAAGQTVEPIEAARDRKDGSVMDVELTISSIKNGKGEIVGLSCIVRDITEKKRAKAALAESELRLRRLSDAAYEGIAITRDGIIVDANTALLSELGYPDLSSFVGANGIEIATAEYQPLVRRHVEHGLEDMYEAVLQRKDGSTFIAQVRARQAVHNGRPERITAIRNVTKERTLEKELLERDQKMRALLESAPIIMYTADRTGTVTFCEGQGLAALGLTSREVVGNSVYNFGDDEGTTTASVNRVLAGEPVSYDVKIGAFSFHTELRPVFDSNETVSEFIGVSFDVTERVTSEKRFRALFEHSSHAHLIFDEVSGIIDCNSAALEMMHSSDKHDLLGKHPACLSADLQPDGRLSIEKGDEMCRLARENGRHVFEWLRRTVDGKEYPVEVTLTTIELSGKSMLMSVWHDLSERKRQEDEIRVHTAAVEFQKKELENLNSVLEGLARTDGLTNLKNRRTFQERLAEEVDRAARYETPLSLILFDVDRFKEYNDTYGHPAGDEILKSVSSIILEEVRSTDVAARYGGEEFAVILPMTDLPSAIIVAEQLRHAIEDYGWEMSPVTASFGVSSLSPTTDDGAAIVAAADAALYESKNAGRNRVSSGGRPSALSGKSWGDMRPTLRRR